MAVRSDQGRKAPRRLVVIGVFLAAAALAALAHADQVLVDNDLALPGHQNMVSLTGLPGDTLETSGQIVLQWNGHHHLDPGDSLTFAADPASTTLPSGYAVEPVTLTVPGSWGPGGLISGKSAISFTAPGAGQYQYGVTWKPPESPHGSNCVSAPPCLTGAPALELDLTVDKADTTTTTHVRDAGNGDVTGSSQPLGTTIHDSAVVDGAIDASRSRAR